jgi:[ribosomal protein S18]-alanine N-acetyltransferase
LINRVRAKHGKNIFLEVRESNQRARAFYRKAHFKETGVRKSYYSGPKEGAALYSLTFP